MKKRLLKWFLIILTIPLIITGCKKENEYIKANDYNSNEVIKEVIAIINDKEYIIRLENNETAKSFLDILPKEFDMKELNGNEKYIYLDKDLPTNATTPQRINAGDIMIYGNNCLVIFYKSFDTNYSYTKIGHIDKMPDLDNKDISIIIKK